MKKPLMMLLGAAMALSFTAGASTMTLQQAVDNPDRPAAQKTRDQYRHPLETLQFFGIKPGMTVVELWPGPQGWYSAILAPYLKDQGHFIAANFNTQLGAEPTPTQKYYAKAGKGYEALLESNKGKWGNVSLAVLAPPEQMQLAPPGSVDAVLTFRNLHNWHKAGQLKGVFEAAYAALKPGGVFGVVEHRGKAGITEEAMAESGYMGEDFVIDLAKQVGFKLDAKSEVNANPKDDKDHPRGVWTLPPTLAMGDQDKAKYLAIGESDRMTLKFVKP
ncbi:methyltransferase [Gallaecimonas kandeliae]|uniref:class I SAM-dependent methyltransferase n=1 Tax=Gallaecimonas kandeliae TaxID=3029055 RepID=UPI002648828E|nr:methyltransferase [Gallaecimonas kandeliae]WKE64409.1 methyltransferase [Gallaecimonas kandeliae]